METSNTNHHQHKNNSVHICEIHKLGRPIQALHTIQNSVLLKEVLAQKISAGSKLDRGEVIREWKRENQIDPYVLRALPNNDCSAKGMLTWDIIMNHLT